MELSLIEYVRLHEARIVNAVLVKIRQLHPEYQLSPEDIKACHDTAGALFNESREDFEARQRKAA